MTRFSDAQHGRRRFLRGAALTSAAAAFVAAARGWTSDDSGRKSRNGGTADNTKSKGYRLTPHIEAYYRSARG